MHADLVDALNKILGDTFVMYFKAHSSHWNIEGPDFYEYHIFLQSIYEEVHAAVDIIAENIRQLDAYAPASLMKIKNNSAITEDDIVGSPMQMMNNLIGANDIVLLSLMRGYKIAEAAGEIGISNSLQDRVIAHQKHRWMLNATVK